MTRMLRLATVTGVVGGLPLLMVAITGERGRWAVTSAVLCSLALGAAACRIVSRIDARERRR